MGVYSKRDRWVLDLEYDWENAVFYVFTLVWNFLVMYHSVGQTIVPSSTTTICQENKWRSPPLTNVSKLEPPVRGQLFQD